MERSIAAAGRVETVCSRLKMVENTLEPGTETSFTGMEYSQMEKASAKASGKKGSDMGNKPSIGTATVGSQIDCIIWTNVSQ